MLHVLFKHDYGERKALWPLMALCLLLAMAAQKTWADSTLTLEASTKLPGEAVGDESVPEHVYTLHNAQNPPLYWREDLLPDNGKQNWGTFAFYAVDGVADAYYIYDCSMGQWLVYDVKDSYGAAQKGTGKKDYITLSDTRNDKAFFIAETAGKGYQFGLVDTNGKQPSVPWYINFYGGYSVNTTNTLGIWWHNGEKDAGSQWLLALPPSSDGIEVATTAPEDAGDNRLEHVFTLQNGYGASVGLTLMPTTDEDGHYVFYKVDGVDNAYYIYDYSKGKWLTYDMRESYNPDHEAKHGEKDFVKLSAEKGNYFFIEQCQMNGIKGYEIQPYTSNGDVSDVYLNYYTGAHLNKTNTLGYYTHHGSRDLGSLWRLEATDPHRRTISELGTASQFDYLGDVDVTLTRTLKTGSWNTLCLPFNVSEAQLKTALGESCRLRQFSSVDGDGKTLRFTQATAVEAGKPYLVDPAADAVNPVFTTSTIREDLAQAVQQGQYSMVGTYGQATLTTDGTNLFMTAENRFKKPKDNLNKHNILKGLRAYFTVPAGTDSAVMQAVIDGQATAIDNISADTDSSAEQSPVYNLQGQHMGNGLEGLAPGVYIQNGKKHVVR